MPTKEFVSKISDIFLGSVTSSDSEIILTPPNQINYSTRSGYGVKMKLEWSAEETSGTPKKKIDQYCSEPDALK